MVKEQEVIRHEQLSLGVIQDRQGKDIATIKKHLGLNGNNSKGRGKANPKQPLTRNKKSK